MSSSVSQDLQPMNLTAGPRGHNTTSRCPVCLDTIETDALTVTHPPCGNSVHRTCYDAWCGSLPRIQAKRCLICQQQIKPKWGEVALSEEALDKLIRYLILGGIALLSLVLSGCSYYLNTTHGSRMCATWNLAILLPASEITINYCIRANFEHWHVVFFISFLVWGNIIGVIALALSVFSKVAGIAWYVYWTSEITQSLLEDLKRGPNYRQRI